MKNKLLSVIIPVYNGSNYVDKCMESLLNQTYRNLEIITINDGSKDDSLEKLEKYASIDSRVKVIDQVNQGSSKTRENGINIATGDFITFVDIDDYIELDTYAIAMKEIEDYDILTFGVSCDYETENYSVTRSMSSSGKDAIKLMFKNEIFNFVWNKIYRTSLIQGKNFFPTDFNQGEDLIFNCLAFSNAKSNKVIDNVLYHYIYRQKDSMISTFTKNNDYVLKNKRKYVYQLLGDCEAYYDYMLKEYEVFTINLFMKNNHLSFNEKRKMIIDNILEDDVIKKGIPNNTYGKIFKMIGSSKNATIIVASYGVLNMLKNILGNGYLKVRKALYKK